MMRTTLNAINSSGIDVVKTVLGIGALSQGVMTEENFGTKTQLLLDARLGFLNWLKGGVERNMM